MISFWPQESVGELGVRLLNCSVFEVEISAALKVKWKSVSLQLMGQNSALNVKLHVPVISDIFNIS